MQRRQGEDLEVDEMWTFVGRKRRKVWLWLAVERASRRIVAWVLGSRGTATLRRLWAALPRRYHRHTRYFTDQWRAYRQVLPAGAHIVGKSGTRVVEALNGKLRHRCGVLVRRFARSANAASATSGESKLPLTSIIQKSPCINPLPTRPS